MRQPSLSQAMSTGVNIYSMTNSDVCATQTKSQQILSANSMPRKPINLAGVAHDLKALAKINAKEARNSYAEILVRLRPVQQGELQRLIGRALESPLTRQDQLKKGQNVVRATSMASDALHDTAVVRMRVRGSAALAPLPVKLAFASVDAKMKYDELRAQGFSHGAALFGMSAGQAASLGIAGTGAAVGGAVGAVATSPSGPGAIVGAGIGGVAGGAIAGGIDWVFGISDDAALAAANKYDGKTIE